MNNENPKDTKKGAGGSTVEQSSRPRSLDPVFFMGKTAEYAAMDDKEAKSELEIAAALKIDKQHIVTVKRLAGLADGVKSLVSEGKLAISTAAIIGRYPKGVHKMFADGILAKELPLNQLQRGPIPDDKTRPLKERVKNANPRLKWSAGVDDNGELIEEE